MVPLETPTPGETPAGSLLSVCVRDGAVEQEELDSALSGLGPAFSAQLLETEQRISAQREQDLLALEEEDAANLGLGPAPLQLLGSHLLELLRAQRSLGLRLGGAQVQEGLQIPAHLHRATVHSGTSMIDFVQNLQQRLTWTRTQQDPHLSHTQLDLARTRLLALAADMLRTGNKAGADPNQEERGSEASLKEDTSSHHSLLL